MLKTLKSLMLSQYNILMYYKRMAIRIMVCTSCNEFVSLMLYVVYVVHDTVNCQYPY